jgi:cation diffusion facilitator CzcD-associated flavoprotein CzcO
MRFGSVVETARWDEQAQHWEISVVGQEPVTAKYLLSATGFLSQPKMPDIDGIDSFEGKVIHSTDWDASHDLRGKRAAVIGTGATAVQLIPSIVDDLEALTVYQRTPIYVVPKIDGRIPAPVRRLFRAAPATQRVARFVNDGLLEALMVGGVLHYRQARLFNRGAELLARAHLFAQVRDRDLRRKLTPHYSFGCKRPTFSNVYFRAFTKPHVTLETTPIARVEPDGIVTEDGRKTVIDTLLLATGFDLWEANFPAIQIIGRDGRDLGKWWRENRFGSYQGVSIPNFPNYLSLVSPYSYSGLSYFTTIESQMKHIARLLGEVERQGAATFEIRDVAYEKFLDDSIERLKDSVFVLGNCGPARSYYFNQHGEPALLRPSTTANAFKEQARFPLEDYAFA